MTYKRITKDELILIGYWSKEHKSINEIGLLLDRSPSSISREISRNTGKKCYRPKQAQRLFNKTKTVFLEPILLDAYDCTLRRNFNATHFQRI